MEGDKRRDMKRENEKDVGKISDGKKYSKW